MRRYRTRQRDHPVLLSVACVIALAASVFSARAATLYGLVDTAQLFQSVDGGVTWTVLAVLPASDAIEISAGDTGDELFLATRSGSVYRSVNAGVDWTLVGVVNASDVVAMVIQETGHLFLLTRTGTLYKSVDDGTTFNAVAVLTGSDYASIAEERIAGALYAVTETGDVAQSVNFGVSWTNVGAIGVSDAVEIRAMNGELFVLADAGDVAKSVDAGVTWTFVGTLSQVNVRACTVDDGSLLVAATDEGLVATSAAGAAWTWQGTINQVHVVSVGTNTPTGTSVRAGPPPFAVLALRSVFPNPISTQGEEVSFVVELSQTDRVALELYDVSGRSVARRPAEDYPGPGAHVVRWKVALPSGVYFARLVGRFATTHEGPKLVVVR